MLSSLIGITSSCSSKKAADARIDTAIDSYIEHEKSQITSNVTPILEIYLGSCVYPKPPNNSTMLSYEIALRDAVVSFRSCNKKYQELIFRVREKNKEIAGGVHGD